MEDTDNVTEFPQRDGASMPPDRSGSMTRQQMRAKQRGEEKSRKAAVQQQKDLERLMNTPVTKQEFQRAMFHVFGALEKTIANFRKLGARHEAMQNALYSKGYITREEYEDFANKQIEWNNQIDMIVNSYETTGVNEVVRMVSEWNAVNEQKIGWQHIDLAPRLLADQSLTLEEKLVIAADLEMPEAFIAELRKQEAGEEGDPEDVANEYAAILSPDEVMAKANAEIAMGRSDSIPVTVGYSHPTT